MISKEEHDKALGVIQEYNRQLNLKYVHNRICCVCKENSVDKIEPSSTQPLKQEQGMWNDGVVEKISFGYGSRYDMSSFYIAICDDCIEDLLKSGLATDLKAIRKAIS